MQKKPSDKKLYSLKFNAPGISYEIGFSLRKGHIVWAHGCFSCVRYNDLIIARNLLVSFINENEKIMAKG